MGSATQATITCPQCSRTSANPNDVRFRYCGACHAFHDTMIERAIALLANTDRYSVKDNETGRWLA